MRTIINSFDQATHHMSEALEAIDAAEHNLFVLSFCSFTDQAVCNEFIANINKVHASLTSLHTLLADNKEYIPCYTDCCAKLTKLQVGYKAQSYFDGVM